MTPYPISPRVFVVHNDGRFDLTDAVRYGVLVNVYRRDFYPDETDERVPSVIRMAYDVLRHFDAGKDFLCLVGSPIYTAVCMYVLGSMGKSPVHVLRYDRIAQAYYPIPINNLRPRVEEPAK